MSSYLQLFLRGIKPGRPQSKNATVIAFTSALKGEGVTHVTESFGADVAKRLRKRTVITDTETLQKLNIYQYQDLPRYCCKTSIPGLHVLQDPGDDEADYIDDSLALAPLKDASEIDRGIDNLQTLRYAFDYILVDCPSIEESGDAPLLASSVDGVVMVVAAESTRKEQVRNALDTMEVADGNILGCIMNKRRYPIPGWIYNRL